MVGVGVVVLAAVGALRFVDTTWYPVVVAQTAGPFVVVALGLLLAVTALLRRWWLLVPVAVALTAGLVVAVPTFLSSTSPRAQIDLTVMTSNLRFGAARTDQLMDAVRFRNVDVLVVLEVTPDAVSRLDASGAHRYFSARAGQARPGSVAGTLVLSRLPLTVVSATGDGRAESTGNLQPEVTVAVGGTSVRLKAVHPGPPIPGGTERWRDGLRALTAWRERQTGPGPIVMLGDFNAAFGNPGFRQVTDGLVDAQRAAGQGWVRTWPVVGSRLPAYVQIDHVLSRGLVLVSAGQAAIHGTDHALVWASYSAP